MFLFNFRGRLVVEDLEYKIYWFAFGIIYDLFYGRGW